MMHKLSLKKIRFELNDTMLRPTSAYSITGDVKWEKDGLSMKFSMREKLSPFDNVNEKSKQKIEYAKGTIYFSTGLESETMASNRLCNSLNKDLTRFDLFQEDMHPNWSLRDFLLCRHFCTRQKNISPRDL